MSMLGSGAVTRIVAADSRTKQSHKDECDVNIILDRFRRGGAITHLAAGTPQYVDVSEMSDYRAAIEQVRAAEDYFSRLPAKVRAYFENDVAAFVDSLARPDAPKELRDLVDEFFGGRKPDSSPSSPDASDVSDPVEADSGE